MLLNNQEIFFEHSCMNFSYSYINFILTFSRNLFKDFRQRLFPELSGIFPRIPSGLSPFATLRMYYGISLRSFRQGTRDIFKNFYMDSSISFKKFFKGFTKKEIQTFFRNSSSNTSGAVPLVLLLEFPQ